MRTGRAISSAGSKAAPARPSWPARISTRSSAEAPSTARPESSRPSRCLERIREERCRLSKPLEVAAFTDEEGNLVGDFLGSRAFIGALDRQALESGKTALGIPFAEILKKTPFTVDTILDAHRQAPELDAYLELHIEQGTTLDDEGVPIGIVDTIRGKHYRWCSFVGASGHSGTVPLELRRDAFLGLADFALRATRHVAANHYGSLVTIGRAIVHPGAFSVVPGRADFSFEFRSGDAATLAALEQELFALAEDVASARGLVFRSRIVDATQPVTVPARLAGMLAEECDKLGYSRMSLPSGAGHDAQILAAKTETAMIFIPSPEGASHCPEETVRWEDLEKGANLLLAALLRPVRPASIPQEKNFLDGGPEDARDLQGQVGRGNPFFVLDEIDRGPSHAGQLGELFLRHPLLGPKNAHVIPQNALTHREPRDCRRGTIR